MSYRDTKPAPLLMLATVLCLLHPVSSPSRADRAAEIERSDVSPTDMKPRVRRGEGEKYFKDGFRKYLVVHPRGDFVEARVADWQNLNVDPKSVGRYMLAAIEYWPPPEEGETVWASQGITVLYVPHFYLGVVYYETECFREAVEQFEKSILADQVIPGAGNEKKTLDLLKQNAEDYSERSKDCSDWSRLHETTEHVRPTER